MTGLTGYSEEAKEKFAKDSPMNRVSKPVEIADIILVLCSHLASFVTGAAWAVDGGTTAGKW